MSDKEDEEKYRLAQAQKLLDLFEAAHGRKAATATVEELEAWFVSPEGKAAMAYDLTPEGKIIP